MYDSNSSQEPTASHRRGPEACGGDLKASAAPEQNAPSRAICRSVWPTLPMRGLLPPFGKTAHGNLQRQGRIHPRRHVRRRSSPASTRHWLQQTQARNFPSQDKTIKPKTNRNTNPTRVFQSFRCVAPKIPRTTRSEASRAPRTRQLLSDLVSRGLLLTERLRPLN